MTNSQSLPDKVPFYNLMVNVIGRAELLGAVRQQAISAGQTTINFLNAHCFNIAQQNEPYKKALNSCTFLLNDGVGVDIAGKFAGVRFEENLNGTDLIPEILDVLASANQSVFLFGAKPDVIAKAAKSIASTHPNLTIAGFCDGYATDPQEVVDQIRSSSADAVILGLGVPLQELWVEQHADEVKCAKVFVCGGAIFDFISGNVRRAPEAIRRIKLEWLYRLIQEPKRLFSRYVLGSFQFLYYLVTRRRK